jgi:hypothetical protein
MESLEQRIRPARFPIAQGEMSSGGRGQDWGKVTTTPVQYLEYRENARQLAPLPQA